jgi:hypothetical protein
MVAEWELPDDCSLGLMPGLFVERNALGKRYAGGIFAVVAGKSFTDDARGFVELSGRQLASRKNGGNGVSVDAGLAYLVTPSVQIDTAVSRGLTRNTPDFSWTAGLSIRY